MKSFDKWVAMVPETITADPLWRMKVYRLALFLNDLAWHDVTKLAADARTLRVADQLYRAVGSIGANIAEGYSRRSGKDRARFYEYSLGSGRESRHWYWSGRQMLGDTVTEHRLAILAEITRLLLAIVPRERKHNLAEKSATYELDLSGLLDNLPLP